MVTTREKYKETANITKPLVHNSIILYVSKLLRQHVYRHIE